jgi:hypothetical protein
MNDALFELNGVWELSSVVGRWWVSHLALCSATSLESHRHLDALAVCWWSLVC